MVYSYQFCHSGVDVARNGASGFCVMALLKSNALILQEAEQELARQQADACYAILEGWQPKVPIMTPIVELPALSLKEDTAPFKFNYGHLPSRYCNRQKRWSEI